MQHFSAEATIFSKKNLKLFFAPENQAAENMKKLCQKMLIIGPNFFQFRQLAQNQSKSQFLFYNYCSWRDLLCIMTLSSNEFLMHS